MLALGACKVSQADVPTSRLPAATRRGWRRSRRCLRCRRRPLSSKSRSRKTSSGNASWQPNCHRNYRVSLLGAVQRCHRKCSRRSPDPFELATRPRRGTRPPCWLIVTNELQLRRVSDRSDDRILQSLTASIGHCGLRRGESQFHLCQRIIIFRPSHERLAAQRRPPLEPELPLLLPWSRRRQRRRTRARNDGMSVGRQHRCGDRTQRAALWCGRMELTHDIHRNLHRTLAGSPCPYTCSRKRTRPATQAASRAMGSAGVRLMPQPVCFCSSFWLSLPA